MYKCVKTIPPKAENAIFIEKADGTLLFNGENPGESGWLKDSDISDIATGHFSSYAGDSGGPFWTEVVVDGESRQTLVAVYNAHRNVPPPVDVSELPKDQCRLLASKVSKDVVKWINENMQLIMHMKMPYSQV